MKKIARWLHDFRQRGMTGLLPQIEFARELYTPERVILALLYFKCCASRAAADRELARAISEDVTGMSVATEAKYLWKRSARVWSEISAH